MENYAYSYPDSGDSSPRSREIDFENPPPSWEEQPLPGNIKVKFMVSYGGKIHPRPHDNLLAYVGGETKILSVERSIKFSQILAKLSSICDGVDINFKYQLPGEDLDALISVTNDDDLEHMMLEYDRLYRNSPKPVRLRLFLFPINQSVYGSGSSDARSERFVEALNSVPVQVPGVLDSTATVTPPNPHVPVAVSAPVVTNNVDYLFGIEKGVGAGVVQPPHHLPQQVVKIHDPVSDPENAYDERITRSDPQIDARILEMNRLQIAEQQRHQQHQQHQQQQQQQQQQIYRQKGEESYMGGYAGDGYAQKLPEKMLPVSIPAAVIPASGAAAPVSYWAPEKNVSAGSGYPVTVGHEQLQHQQIQQQHHQQPQQPQQPHYQQQQVYMIPAPTGMYHAPVVQPQNSQGSTGYYQMAQRIPADMYREHQQQQQQPQQQVYNMFPPQMSSPPPTTVPVSLPPQGQALPKMSAPYAEGIGMQVRQVAAPTSAGMNETGYAQVAYDNTTGRQMQYHYTAAPGGGAVTAPFQGVPGSAATANVDARAGGGLTAEGKTVQKPLPTSAPV